MTTIDTCDYYPSLLILQYIGKRKASATIKTTVVPVIMPQTTVETITFSPVPDSGLFVLSYAGSLATINWDDSTATIQKKLRGLSTSGVDGGDSGTTVFDDSADGGDASTVVFSFDLDGGDADGFDAGSVTVTGSIASGLLTVTFTGVTPPAFMLELVSSTLTGGGNPTLIDIEETDEALPLAVQNGFNLFGSNPAVGVQLDTLGLYAGVLRTGSGFTQQITLNDADYLTLIKLAIIENSAGSSLAEIQSLIFNAFAGNVVLSDYADMFMAYYLSSAIASSDLLQLFVTEGKLPKPMGVGLVVITFDATDAFAFDNPPNSGGFGDVSNPATGGKLASIYITY